MPPRTMNFSGSGFSSNGTSRVAFEGLGLNAASITFTEGRLPTKVMFDYCLLSKLTESFFSEGFEPPVTEQLIHTWTHRKSDKKFVIYAGVEQQALICSAQTASDMESFFEKAQLSGYLDDDYHREKAFCNLLQKNNITVEALRAIPGMDDAFMVWLAGKLNGLAKLIENGITFEQLVKVNRKKLEKCLISTSLDTALKFLTIQQILGINSTPRPLQNIVLSQPFANCVMIGGERETSDYAGTLTNTYSKNRFSLSYKDNATGLESKAQLTFGQVAENATLPPIEQAVETRLVHEWHITTAQDASQKIYVMHCPELNYLVSETWDVTYPPKKLPDDLDKIPYYRELKFSQLLKSKAGLTIESLRQMEGMTQTKLILLCDFQGMFTDLMAQGIKVEHFGAVMEERLTYVIQNYTEARQALQFVDAFELLAIPNLRPRYSTLYTMAHNVVRGISSSLGY